jgi:hypothetical protein
MPLKDTISAYEDMQKIMKTKIQEMMKEEFSKFFKEVPEVKAIGWVQYTPYFNDGDECTFSKDDFLASFKDLDDDDLREKIFEAECDSVPEPDANTRQSTASWAIRAVERYNALSNEDKVTSEKFRAFAGSVNGVPNDVWKAAFGDHVMVIATKDGFKIEEYEHD